MMKRIILTTLLGLMVFGMKAQNHISLYNFDHVNQNLMVNPASPHPYRFVIGIPGLSSINTHINTSASWGSIFEKGSDVNKKFEETLNSLTGKERLNFSESLDMLFVGFGAKNGYFTIGAQEVADVNITFPGELMRFLYYGNVGSDYFGKALDMSNFNASLTTRINYHIGYQHYVDSNLTVGGRFKYISGVANVHTSKFNTSVYTDIDKIEISTDILFQTSGLGLTDNFQTSDLTEMISAKNSGMAFDFGAHYRINERWDVSASILDFGWINWKKDLKGYSSNGKFVYEGLDFEYVPDDTTGFGDQLENMLDTLESQLNFTESDINSYRTSLPMQIMASGQFHLTPKHVFGVVYQGSFWNDNMYHSYGVQYIGKWHKMINFMAGYSVIDNIQNNLSLGLSLRLGAFQIYAMTDNVFGVLEPTNISATSVRAGINLSFFDKPKILTEEQTQSN